MDNDHGFSVMRPLPNVAVGDNVGLLSSRDPDGTSITTTAMEPRSHYRGRHSRGNSRDERLRAIEESESRRGEDAFELMQPSTAASKARRPSPGPLSSGGASSILRRLTTKYVSPLTRSNFRSTTKRSLGRQYATLDDGDVADPVAVAVDISSLEGMGWEMTDLSRLAALDANANANASADADTAQLLPESETAYVRPVQRKPDFRSFVDKRPSVGEGMRDIGVQLRRDPTKAVRGSSYAAGAAVAAGRRDGSSTGVDRSKTVRDLGQNLAQEKNVIVEVEEVVDLSSLEGGGGQTANRASQMFESTSMSTRNNGSSGPQQQTKSYFFPEDPDIPNWKPWSMSSIYILCLMVLALGLAGFQEYLCQLSFKRARQNSGLLAFNRVADISTWYFFLWKCESFVSPGEFFVEIGWRRLRQWDSADFEGFL